MNPLFSYTTYIVDNKLISIITVCRNAEKHLEQTILSVIEQTSTQYELIIVDGGSTDGTLDIVRKYDSYISKWVSESDEGISDAMNKGLSMAAGEYIYFLHSDDYLSSSDSLAKVIDAIDQSEIHLFNLYYKTSTGITLKKPRGFNNWLWFKTGVFHQACLCHRRLFDRIGTFDTSFRIAMDHDFFLRAYKNKASVSYHDCAFSVMRDTGISGNKDWPSLSSRFAEEKRLQHKNNPPT